jgi:signal transduction histidine kinase
MSQFTVDTHLFRELGEFLVGRDSTALVELVKNAYDADATEVAIHAEQLDDPGHGSILVRDNGLGMTRDQFEEGFLRIASRIKERAGRISPKFHRRYTGAKGIGRLAAHKLSKVLEVHSVAIDPRTLRPIEGFHATIDWRRVEEAVTLDKVAPEAVRVESFEPRPSTVGGTTLVLRHLRRHWTERERRHFVSEAQSTLAPRFLTSKSIGRLLKHTLLFDEVHQHSTDDPGAWTIHLTGDFEVGDEYFEAAADAASWVLEVDATAIHPRFGIAPTKKYAVHNPEASVVVRELERASPPDYPRFQARALIREGDWNSGPDSIARWRSGAFGFRVYLEGFRVLPYAEIGNDWLDLDRTYTGRRRTDPLTAGLFDDLDLDDKNVLLGHVPSRNYLGGVFLTLRGAEHLQVLVNREGFVPNAHFFHVQETLKTATSFATRVRSAAKTLARDDRRKSRLESAARKYERTRQQDTPTRDLEAAANSGIALLHEVRAAIGAGNMAVAIERASEAERLLESAPSTAREIRDEQAMVFVLASLGAQTAAFVHEVQGLLAVAGALERSLSEIAETATDYGKEKRRTLARVAAAAAELRLGLERQAAYLTEIGSANARRRRSRQPLAERFQSAVDLVAHLAERRHITIENKISPELKSPPMFRAEMTAIFSNLLTNAIKAAGEKGKISASGERSHGGPSQVRVENTGVAVEPREGEIWFRPFSSTTADVDPSLGKGLGLGLPITRRMLDEYGAEIRFAVPTAGFATSVEIIFPE